MLRAIDGFALLDDYSIVCVTIDLSRNNRPMQMQTETI